VDRSSPGTIHQPVPVVINPASARAVGFEDVRNFGIAELVDKIDARLDGNIFEQIIRSGGNRRGDSQRQHRRTRWRAAGLASCRLIAMAASAKTTQTAMTAANRHK